MLLDDSLRLFMCKNKSFPKESREKVETWNVTNNQDSELNTRLDKFNQIKVYFLITDNISSEINEPGLILLQPEDRLNSEQLLINERHFKILFSIINSRPNNSKDLSELTSKKLPSTFNLSEIIRSDIIKSSKKYFRDSQAYSNDKVKKYKPIFPFFLDQSSAESFLVEAASEALTFLKNTPQENNQEIIDTLLKTKIVRIGLGDFMTFYNFPDTLDEFSELNFNDDVEFLLVPSL